MDEPDSILIRLTFRRSSTPDERADSVACLPTKLVEILNETTAFAGFRVEER